MNANYNLKLNNMTGPIMFLQPGALVQQALQLFQQGDWQKAANKLQTCLLSQPKNFDALHLLGVVRGLQGDAVGACKLFEKAISLDPHHQRLHFNYAKALSDSGMDEKALPHHRKATELSPQHKEAWLNLGRSLESLMRHEEALGAYDRALSIAPDFAQAGFHRGCTLQSLGRFKDALTALDYTLRALPDFGQAWHQKALAHSAIGHYELAIDADKRCLQLLPQHAEAAYNLGVFHTQLEQHELALKYYEAALAINPQIVQAWSNKGATLNIMRRFDQALSTYEHALTLTPDSADLWFNKGATCTDMGRYMDAITSFDRALALDPISSRAWSNKGTALVHLHQYEQALNAFQRALEIDPEYHAALENLGHLHLGMMNFDLGWDYYDRRGVATKYGSAGAGLSTQDRKGKPLWDGQPRSNTLLVWSEQGLGDQILYGSMLSELSQWPQNLVVALDARMLGLWQRAMPKVQFMDASQLPFFNAFDEHISLASLGRVLRRKVTDFAKTPHPYLEADSKRLATLAQRVQNVGSNVWGLSWRSKNQDIGHEKSINLLQLSALMAQTSAQWIDLQYGDTSAERLALSELTGCQIHSVPDVDNFNDIEGLAALIMACRGVVTTSNSTAHLAGALNQHCAVLVPFGRGKLWYWHDIDGQSLWYPSVRVLEQAADGSWDKAIEQALVFVQEAA